MSLIIRSRIFAAALVLASPLASVCAENAEAPSQQAATREKVIIQVSDSVPGKWNLALNNARNVQEALGKDKVDIEIVAYGPGIEMLKLESEVGNRIGKALTDGVKIVACENSMKSMKISQADMLPSIGYVRSGVVELMKRQKEGWAYIRP